MDFDQAVAELEALVDQLEHERDERALRALELVDVIHRAALGLIAAGDLDHPVARAVLAMYDLVPPDEATLVEEALDEIRPIVSRGGCELQLAEVCDGDVRVKLTGARSADHTWVSQVRALIASALESRYASFARLTIEGAPATWTPLPMPVRRKPQASDGARR